MRRVALLGAGGFVGSAFRRLLDGAPGVALTPVELADYAQHAGRGRWDVVVDAAGSSVKWVADEDPLLDFDRSVAHRLRALRDFPADLHLHVSSVDVYSDLTSPATTAEDAPIDPARQSNYGFHKSLAEQVTRHYAAESWIIVRLAGMVGPGLRKNPVFDILHGQPLRIHPDSRYQFMHTDDVARAAWALVEERAAGTVLNVCGDGVITPREIAAAAGRPLDLSQLPPGAEPRVVDVSVERLRRRGPVPATSEAVRRYLAEAGAYS